MIDIVTTSLVQDAIAVLAHGLSMAVVFGLVWRLWPVFVEVIWLLVERSLASLAERLGMEARRPASTTARRFAPGRHRGRLRGPGVDVPRVVVRVGERAVKACLTRQR